MTLPHKHHWNTPPSFSPCLTHQPRVKPHFWANLTLSKAPMTKWCRVISWELQTLISHWQNKVNAVTSFWSLALKSVSFFLRGSQIDFARLISKFSVISCSLCRSRTNIWRYQVCIHPLPLKEPQALGSCFHSHTLLFLLLDISAGAVRVDLHCHSMTSQTSSSVVLKVRRYWG